MRVAVNLTWLAPGRVGGSEEYLTRQLLGLDPSVDVELFCDPALPVHHPDLAERCGVRPIPAALTSRPARIVLEHTWLAVTTRGHDVIHHGGGTLPLIGNGPTVLTVHDLQYRHFPEYFSRTRRAYLSAMMPRSARRAEIVAVPSEFVRSDVVEAFGVPADRVVVVPHGVPVMTQPTDEQMCATRDRYGLGDRPYVLFPAITHPHKGHVVLVEMLDHLEDDTALVLIGGAGAAEPDLAAAIADSSHAGRVFRLGRVPPDERDALIAGADALAFPSQFEGFGAPVIEAMAFGTPVVCSTADALVEVVGDAGVVVAERSAAAWADGITEARSRAAELVERGHRRRGVFTVEASGRAIEAAYHLAAS